MMAGAGVGPGVGAGAVTEEGAGLGLGLKLGHAAQDRPTRRANPLARMDPRASVLCAGLLRGWEGDGPVDGPSCAVATLGRRQAEK